MARHAGVSASTVGRIWWRNGLRPHRTKTLKLSNDKHFERKFWDVIGLHVDPPEKSVVLCCDEKTQCQALESTHFTPTSSSWMNLVERFFADVTEDRARAGSFASVKELTDAITSYLSARNENPRPYKWKASGKEILAKVQRAREALAEVQVK